MKRSTLCKVMRLERKRSTLCKVMRLEMVRRGCIISFCFQSLKQSPWGLIVYFGSDSDNQDTYIIFDLTERNRAGAAVCFPANLAFFVFALLFRLFFGLGQDLQQFFKYLFSLKFYFLAFFLSFFLSFFFLSFFLSSFFFFPHSLLAAVYRVKPVACEKINVMSSRG